MSEKTHTGTVNEANAYRQIILNFSDPLELVREAISNAIDARANKIKIVIDWHGSPSGGNELRIQIDDDGHGMDEASLIRFFNLGDPAKGLEKKDGGADDLIGEKGFGAKIYLNSRKVEVFTTHAQTGASLRAVSEGHRERIYNRGNPPEVIFNTGARSEPGTQIIIYGYNHDDGSKFNHERVKDYILWFTKFGSFETLLWQKSPQKYAQSQERLKDITLDLRGLGYEGGDFEIIQFGHHFPDERFDNSSVTAKAKALKASRTDVYCRRFVLDGQLKAVPGVRWEAVFSIEGNRVKYENRMVRRQGYKNAPPGAYKVAERYGIWLCKDFIPVEPVNFLVNSKGSEYTKFHAFFNCQEMRLSADRTSIGPTDPKLRAAIYEEITEKVREIMKDEGVDQVLESLDEIDEVEKTDEVVKRQFTSRLKAIRKAKHATFQGVDLVEPNKEQAVVALLAQMLTQKNHHLPFRVLDWNSSEGLDILARDTTENTLDDASKFYIECKHTLTSRFNHSLASVKYIICWETDLENDSEVLGVGDDRRRVLIKPKTVEKPYTQYYLVRDDDPSKLVEAIVLKRYLQERLSIAFGEPA